MKTKKGFLVVVCILVMMLFTACSNSDKEKEGEPSAEKVTLTFWKAPHFANEKDVWATIIQKFETENPNIHIEFLETPWDGWDQKYTAAFAGQNPPDLSYMPEYFVKFAKNGQLADLSTYFSEEEQAKYSQSIIDYMRINGKIYTMPYIAASSVVLYNKDLFKEANVQPPQTWEEMVEVSQKLATDGRYAVAGISEQNVIAWMGQAGAFLYGDGNKDVSKLGFHTPEGIKGLQYLADLVLKYEVAPKPTVFTNDDQMGQAFYKENKIAMIMAQAGYISTVRTNAPDFPLGAFLNPAGPAGDPNKQREAYGGLGMLAIAEKSKHKDEAWTFIQFLTSKENAGLYLEKANFLSPLPEINEDMYEGDEIMDVVKESIKNLQLYPPNDRFSTVFDIIRNMKDAVLLGSKTPEQAIKDAIKEYEN
ncbi:ABC transporter substrate-binding protein [Paenibacillus eucommiae]|uniref:Multiple sugar transport system substrate-binding protein n=1 Tax=Paenibacillus eucommiae TaxID=1355755 RepID=A0ABS4J202_9BACL|nr:sugar ABC transporter substrate-binding protein [Paenibacillus eucommiae]MBP1993861.1 multiple sugar transport system substrate-binding protein [Paenibacillus eucommiae]